MKQLNKGLLMRQTIMEKEAKQAPQIIKNQLNTNHKLAIALGKKLRELDPKMVMIIG
jgi:glucosamine--fructose-6-phosphate aminotransferase (isomerizing)